jgi:hypothetical protein
MVTMTFHKNNVRLKVEEEDAGTYEAWFATILLFLLNNNWKDIEDLVHDVDPDELLTWYDNLEHSTT